jgi:hypothetical protein
MMRAQPAPPAVEFDGRVYTPANVHGALRDAAGGFVPSDDPDVAFDAIGWAAALVAALRDTHLGPALREGLAVLLSGADERAARFAAQVARITALLPPGVVSRAILIQSSHGHTGAVDELAWALAAGAGADPDFEYDPILRPVLLRAAAPPGLVMLAARYDGAWFVEHAAAILARDMEEAERQLAWAEIGAASTPQFRARLRAEMAAVRPDLAPLWEDPAPE